MLRDLSSRGLPLTLALLVLQASANDIIAAQFAVAPQSTRRMSVRRGSVAKRSASGGRPAPHSMVGAAAFLGSKFKDDIHNLVHTLQVRSLLCWGLMYGRSLFPLT